MYALDSGTTPAFCDAFMEALEPASDWKEMRGIASKLIYADWENQAEKDIRELLSKAIGMKIEHQSPPGFTMMLPPWTRQSVVSSKPDGVVYNELSRALAIFEMEPESCWGNEAVPLLCNYFIFVNSWLWKNDETAASQAFPCFLVDVHDRVICLHGAIRLPEKYSGYSTRVIHHCVLAKADFVPRQLDDCAMFLSKLKKGIRALEEFWRNDARSMKFDPETEHSLPCDSVSKELCKGLRLTRQMTRNVFEG